MLFGGIVLGKTYRLESGKIRQLYGTRQYKLEFKYLFHVLKNIVIYFICFILVFLATLIVYSKCIIQADLEHTISLGAVFATLGSSLVAVLSLTSNEQYSQFIDNIRILETKLLNKEKWERWPFVKRIQKSKIFKGEYCYYILDNPCIIFKATQLEIKISLPSGKNDFRELPVYRTIIQLVMKRKRYNYILFIRNEMKDKLIWECLIRIYVNVLLYRWSLVIIWIGSCFIFSSVFFSFFYSKFTELVG